MLSTDQPSRISIPFANTGVKRTIPNTSQIGITDGAASFPDGFPPKTFLPLAAGGVPPAGADFNGLLNVITAIQKWQSAGMIFTYDLAYSTAVGGYAKGATLARTDHTGIWVNLADNNTTDPEGGSPSNWVSGTTYFQQTGVGAVVRPMLSKLRERVSIDDYTDLATAFTLLGGTEGTGYGALPVELDLLGKDITFAGVIYRPINLSLINGTVSSAAGRLVTRNPFLANTALRGYTTYWPWMDVCDRKVTFNCITVENCFIGSVREDCLYTGQYSLRVLVNSNSLWTEHGVDTRCEYSGNTTAGAAIILDGNLSGTSVWSTGTGVGTPDGSFGYNNFYQCKIDSTAPTVGVKLIDGATWYNADVGFRGYVRGAGPSGAFVNVTGGTNPSGMNYCNFAVHLESFGAAANILSVADNARFWYNTGSIQSASPQMTFAQGALADLRTNNVLVTGAALQDKTGAAIALGDTYQSYISIHLLKRLMYVASNTFAVDALVAGTSVNSPSVIASLALESRVTNTGAITARPNDTRSASSRNWSISVNSMAFGDLVLSESTTNLNNPATARIQIQSGGNLAPAVDNTQSFGTASQRISVVFAGAGAINTSDKREKEQERELLAAEHAVSVRIKPLIRAFKFKDAVLSKGDGARIHFGVIAQDVKAAFEAEGLVAEAYAVLCYDEWDALPEVLNDDGDVVMPARAAGNRYGIRYDELMAFLIAAL